MSCFVYRVKCDRAGVEPWMFGGQGLFPDGVVCFRGIDNFVYFGDASVDWEPDRLRGMVPPREDGRSIEFVDHHGLSGFAGLRRDESGDSTDGEFGKVQVGIWDDWRGGNSPLRWRTSRGSGGAVVPGVEVGFGDEGHPQGTPVQIPEVLDGVGRTVLPYWFVTDHLEFAGRLVSEAKRLFRQFEALRLEGEGRRDEAVLLLEKNGAMSDDDFRDFIGDLVLVNYRMGRSELEVLGFFDDQNAVASVMHVAIGKGESDGTE